MELLKKDFWDIYHQLNRYFGRAKCVYVPFDDIAQEINIALITGGDNVLKVASRNVDRLFKAYGYSKKLNGKDLFDPEFIYSNSPPEEYYEWRDKALDEIRGLYKSSTARSVCEYYGIEYTSEISQRLSIVFGGKRRIRKNYRIKFSEELAKNIVSDYGLDSRHVRDWRFSGHIPNKIKVNGEWTRFPAPPKI
jgi:hypothetical protein